MISYAQNFEDVMLARAFGSVVGGFYVDVGAWDPEIDSVTKHFYDAGWSGINIEPHPGYHAKLVAGRPRDVNLNCAISDIAEQRPFFLFEETGTSTFEPEIRQTFARFESNEVSVPTRTLKDVLGGHSGPIHFLKIDAEGWEKQVIRSCDWSKHRPAVILAEAVDPSGAPAFGSWDPMLIAAGYTFVYFDGLNRFYVANECPELNEHFSRPPNVFDDFVRVREAVSVNSLAVCERMLASATTALKQSLDEARASGEVIASIVHGGVDELAGVAGQLMIRLVAESRAIRSDFDKMRAEAANARIWAGEVEQARAIEIAGSRNRHGCEPAQDSAP